MNLKILNDSALIFNAETLVREEREKLTSFLHHLKEIERRRLFADFGFKSLFEMTVKHFSFSEDEAYRRISAMKLLKDLPEIENKINLGELTLTHLSLAQKHFRQERKNKSCELSFSKKISTIEQISNTSVREAQKIVFSLSSNPEFVPADRVRLVSENRIELKLSISIETQVKIEKVKGLLAHKHPDISLGELFDFLCNLGLKELSPAKHKKAGQKFYAHKKTSGAPKKRCVKISKAQVRRDVFARANCKCEKCGSEFALEVDHIRPKALGGADDIENMRLLCRSCNQRAAIQVFGIGKMDTYLN